MLRVKPGHRRQSSAAAKMKQLDQRTRRRSSLLRTTNASKDGNVQEAKQEEQASAKNDATSSDSEEEKLTSSHALTFDPLVDCDGKPGQKDDEVANLTTSLSALTFVPPSVRFGRGRGRKGLSDR